jgi:hypothetical protein
MPQTVSQAESMNVLAAAIVLLVIETTVIPNAQVGAPYSLQLVASGGTAPYHWSVTAGALPAGLTLDDTGLLSGVPTGPATTTPDAFTVSVTDSGA